MKRDIISKVFSCLVPLRLSLWSDYVLKVIINEKEAFKCYQMYIIHKFLFDMRYFYNLPQLCADVAKLTFKIML